MAGDEDPDSHERTDPDGGRSASTSAVAIPLVALGLLGAAIWLGSKPTTVPQPVVAPLSGGTTAADPLPSWSDGATKQAILDFVAAVTTESAPTFVPVAERIAVFDHDGTLICEKPVVHGMFLVDRVQALVERRPELAHEEPYATILTGDLEFIRKLGKKFFTELTFSTLAGVPEEKLEAEARDFIRTARHPVFDVPLREVTYQPMQELIALLRSRGFSVWICSGSGVHFMRPAAELWYGIGPEHVIASRPVTELREVEEATPENEKHPNRRLDLVVLPHLLVLNDEERKPVSIGEQIGRRPIFAAGNVGTTGDIEMLRWSQSGPRPSLQLLVLHDDADREMSYSEPTNESLAAAAAYGWQVVRMATDWRQPFAKPLVKQQPVATGHATAPVVATSANEPQAPPTAAIGEGPAPTKWDEELAAFERLDRERPPQPGGIVLLGSSNIRLWNTLADDFPGMNVINRGVGGCRLGELAEFASRLVAAARPKVIVVAAGTNDVNAGATAAEVRDAFERLATELRREHPETTILFLAISPTVKRWDQVERQTAANAAVKDFIETANDGRLVYLDANAAFLGPDGKPAAECFMDDMQHPSTIGNSRRAEILRPALQDLLDGR
ncbi:MAG: haloacid dehalogenase-like hydrolase [Planctomycetia bacterium]|nr:haloacid dehalogenase-like hydrolase [Planctomycetia bacterium]